MMSVGLIVLVFLSVLVRQGESSVKLVWVSIRLDTHTHAHFVSSIPIILLL